MSRVVTIDGTDYDVQEVPVICCANCRRETFTGLCGCPSPVRRIVGQTLYGVPVSATPPDGGS